MLIPILALVLAFPQDLSRVLGEHPEKILCIRFSAKGKTILTGTVGGRVRGWDVKRGRLLFEGGEPHASRIRGVDISKDGRVVSYAVGVGRIVTFDTRDGEISHSVKRDANSDMKVVCLDATDDCRFVWIGDAVGNLVRFYPEDMMKIVQQNLGHGRIGSIAIDPHGKSVSAGCSDGTVVQVSAAKAEIQESWQAHEEPIVALGFSKSLLVTASTDGTIKLWKKKKLESSIDVGSKELSGLALDPKGKWIAAAVSDELRIYSVKDGALLGTIEEVSPGPMAVDPKGKILALGGSDLVLFDMDQLLP